MFPKLSPVTKVIVFTALGGLGAAAIAALVQLPDVKTGLTFYAFTVLGGAAAAMGLWLGDSIIGTSVMAPEECQAKAQALAAQRRLVSANDDGAPTTSAVIANEQGSHRGGQPMLSATCTKRYSANGRLLPRTWGDQ